MMATTTNGAPGVQQAIEDLIKPDRERVEALMFQPDEMIPWPGLNPRKHFNPKDLAELTASVREDGIHQPIVLHDRGANPNTYDPPLAEIPDGIRYFIVAGERRYRAAMEAGRPIPAVVKQFTLAKALRVALIENMARNNLTPLEEGWGFRRILEAEPGLTQPQLAKQLGLDVSQEYVSNRIRLTELPAEIADLVDAGTIQPSHARDYFLPFIHIPERKRRELFKRVVHDVERSPRRKDGEPFRGQEIFDAIVRGARDISKPTSGTDRWTVVFAAGKHAAECKCNGPKFKYGVYGVTVRCFDDKWWKKAQAQARNERKKKQPKKAKSAASSGKSSGALTTQAVHQKYGYNLRPIDSIVVDASKLDDANFIVATDGSKKVVFCTDKKKLDAARSVVETERKRLTETAEAARLDKDQTEAAAMIVDTNVLRAVLRAVAGRDMEVDQVMNDVGIKCKWNEVDKTLGKLPDTQVETLVKIIAIRAKRGEYDNYDGDPIEKYVDQQLEAKYRPGIDALRKKVLAEKKTTAPAKKAAPKKKAPAARKGAKSKRKLPDLTFMKPLTPKPALAAVVGERPIPRSEVTKKVWAYIKAKGLQDKKNRRMVNSDDKLGPVFGGRKQVSMFEMTKLINKNLVP